MAEHNELGKKGEQLAIDFLIEKEYKIHEKNYRYLKAEVDIIAQKDGFLVFVEVKTRVSKKFGKPEEAIDKKKITLYKDAAEGYLEQYPSEAEIRFDVISIVIAKDGTQIEYFPDAF